MEQPNIEEYIKKWEGLRLEPYKDSLGWWTIGWGHWCGEKEPKSITEEEAGDLFFEDLKIARDRLASFLPDYYRLSSNRLTALLDITFNLATKWFKWRAGKFVKYNDWEAAAREFMDSKWAKQVGKRAVEDCTLLRKG